MNREINAADAFVAAWLPGSEGGGIADVLLRDGKDGKVQHDFTRQAQPFSWPKRADQNANNVGQANYDPLFPFGYGLDDQTASELGALPEESGLTADDADPDVYFARGRSALGWQWEVAGEDGKSLGVEQLEGSALAKLFRLSRADHLAQEDAAKLQWQGGGQLRFRMQAHESINLSESDRKGLSLVATMRLDTKPTEAVEIGVTCGTRAARGAWGCGRCLKGWRQAAGHASLCLSSVSNRPAPTWGA